MILLNSIITTSLPDNGTQNPSQSALFTISHFLHSCLFLIRDITTPGSHRNSDEYNSTEHQREKKKRGDRYIV